MKKIYLYLIFTLCAIYADAQYIFEKDHLPEEVSIMKYTSLADAGLKEYSIQQVIGQQANLKFYPVEGKNGNLGFTNHTFWLKFELKNNLETPVFYYLHTAEPVTDHAALYMVGPSNQLTIQKSGDDLNFKKRSVKYRKTLFKIELGAKETKRAYLEIRNDGEKNSLPLVLLSSQKLLEITYHEQLIMGVFYGILLVIALTYFFFYFALKEQSFLYYSLYVVFVALCQFALDGFFHQYIGNGTSWLSLHMVIISAILSCYFFGKYSELILAIKEKNPVFHQLFIGLYVLLGLTLVGIILIPEFLKYSYPLVNVLTLIGILLIFAVIFIKIVKKQPIDRFYTSGIFILFLCLILAVLMNFGILPESFSIDNITKPGIGLEIIALSLSMANHIRVLKTKKEELQTIALQKSEEMNDIKSYFLSNMSHELRTPLNVILGLANQMENDSSDPKVKANCEVIRYASYGLISSVNDILDFSKIENGELQLENSEFKPLEIFNKLSASVRKQTEDKGLRFNYINPISANTVVLGDPVRLEQLLYNLLGNAIKFTTKGSVTFEIRPVIEDRKLKVNILISDTGIGIPKEKLDSVFALFSQTSLDNKRKFGGFGIGLSIVKALVDLHDGVIKLDSREHKGTLCELQLAYELVAQPAVKKIRKAADADDFTGKHILIVEDNPMNQMVIKMMLKNWKNTVVSIANDGAECLELMKITPVDLVLMDLQMPVMDGYEAIGAIRAGQVGESHLRVPIIVLTADVIKSTKDRVFELGANDYMNKPIDRNLLYEKITEIFCE